MQCITIPSNKKQVEEEEDKQENVFPEMKGFKPQTIDTYIEAYKNKKTDPVKVVQQIILKAKLLQDEYKMNNVANINEEDALNQANYSKELLEKGF